LPHVESGLQSAGPGFTRNGLGKLPPQVREKNRAEKPYR
jgi:hypothetical protein